MEPSFSMADESRLARIESALQSQGKTLEEVRTVMINMARQEERMITLFKRMDNYDADQKEVLRRVADIERVSIGRGIFFRTFEKIAWLAAGGAATIAVGYLQAKF